MNGLQNITGSMLWALVALIIVIWAIYSSISSKSKTRRTRAERERVLPTIYPAIRVGATYDVIINNGSSLTAVLFEGVVHRDEDDYCYAANIWAEMVMFKRENGQKIFIRANSIRMIQETLAT